MHHGLTSDALFKDSLARECIVAAQPEVGENGTNIGPLESSPWSHNGDYVN